MSGWTARCCIACCGSSSCIRSRSTGRIPAGIDIGLDRKASCPTLAEFDDYASEHPEQGMPFALPNLDASAVPDARALARAGRAAAAPPALDAAVAEQIATWEQFLNGQSLKERLVARYLYEHLFLGNLHFEGQDPRSFFQLLRSKTPPGAADRADRDARGRTAIPADPSSIACARSRAAWSPRPTSRTSCRRRACSGCASCSSSTPDYTVKALPSYEPERRRESVPSLRGAAASLSLPLPAGGCALLHRGLHQGPRLPRPSGAERDRGPLLDRCSSIPTRRSRPTARTSTSLPTTWRSRTRWKTTCRLVTQLRPLFEARKSLSRGAAQSRSRGACRCPSIARSGLLWNGGGTNPNAALTVYRHSDSASVDQGFVGEPPETAWFLDYPLLERIHYLLVAGFDVYGNLGHQLNTRLHMDVLRMEAEDNLLAYMPAKARKAIHDSWYQGIRSGDGDDIVPWWMDVDLVTGYQTASPQQELYDHLAARLGPLSKPTIPRPCAGTKTVTRRRARQRSCAPTKPSTSCRACTARSSNSCRTWPSFASSWAGAPEADLAYTLLSDKSYDNVSSMFSEHKLGDRRDASGDRQTVLPWLEGSYPEFFFVVPLADVDSFVARYEGIQNRDDYERFTARFGIRRTNPAFWKAADWFNAQALREQPERAGILDLNRYQNR